MPFILYKVLFVAIALTCSTFLPVFSQQINHLQQEAILLNKALEKNHYQPKLLDEKLSRQVITRFINLMDAEHLYFTASDIKEFYQYSPQIKAELQGKSWKFLPQVTSTYKQRLLQADKLSHELLQKPFTFQSKRKTFCR